MGVNESVCVATLTKIRTARMTNILAKLFQDLHHKPLHHHIDRDDNTQLSIYGDAEYCSIHYFPENVRFY